MINVLLFILGIMIGFIISYHLSFILRKILKIKTRYLIKYYDLNECSIKDDNRNLTQYLKFLIIKDKISERIIFNFISYHKNGIKQDIYKKFVYHFYDTDFQQNKYFIDLYRKKNFRTFFDDIFFINHNGTVNHKIDDIKKTLQIK